MDTLTLCRLACSDGFLKNVFGGVYASDSLPSQIKHSTAFIINLDPSHLRGSHWIGIFFAEKSKKKTAYYFDSYGLPPSDENILRFLKQNSSNLFYNRICFQDDYTTTCGYFTLYFLFCYVRKLFSFNLLSKSDKKRNEHLIKKFVRQNFKRSRCCHFEYAKSQACTPWLNMRKSHKRTP